jgi:subtilisin family serine protease
VERAGEMDILVVAAAGNTGADNDKYRSFPASYGQSMSHVLTVMATDDLDDKPGFSNYGDTSVHISAPGMRIVSTHAFLVPGLRPGDLGRYQRYDGTSASAAYVAGAAAFLKTVCPTLGAKVLRDLLVSSADPSRDQRRGSKPRLNLEKARAAAADRCRRLPPHSH